MKKILYILSSTLVTLVTLAACSNETLVNESPLPPAKGNSVTFHIAGLTSATRATPAPNASNPKVIQTPALDREKAIADGRLYAVVFGSDGLIRKVVQAVKLAEGSYNFDLAQSGTFDIRLVANADDALVGKLGTIASASQLDALVASQSPGNNNQATHFLMTSAAKQVTTVASQSTDAGSIQLERAAARIDLFNRIELLKMTRITFKNRYTESRLSRGAANLSMAGLAAPATKVYAAAEGLTDYDCIGAIYGYENMEIGSTVLTLEAAYNGNPIGAHDIVVSGLPLKRNHLYSIVISAKGGAVNPGDVFGSLKFDVVVGDWQEGATIEWKGDQLIGRNAPNFTVTGTNIITVPAAVGNVPAQNPTEIHAPYSATDIVVSVESYPSVAILQSLLPLPAGYSITPGSVLNQEGKFTQEFTIHLADNLSLLEHSFVFVLRNALSNNVKREFTVKQAFKRPTLALEYFAEYDVSTTPGVFTTSYDNDKSGFYNREQFTSNITKLCPNGYHIPVEEEWWGMAPLDQSETRHVRWSSFGGIYQNQLELITVAGVTKTYSNQYRYTATGVTYGIRFTQAMSGTNPATDNSMRAAYRYEWVDTGKLTSHLKVTARYLGIGFVGDISTISNEAWWSNDNTQDVTRLFPAAYGPGTAATYWFSTTPSAPREMIAFSGAEIEIDGIGGQSLSVRCVRD